jgi:hypothetical protein
MPKPAVLKALVLGALFLSFLSGTAYGKGKKEEEPVFHNDQWVLAVTAFDVSSLDPSRRIIGEVISRSLVESLGSVDRHIRVSREYAYYEDYAWVKARSAAAKALAVKRGERDMLLFRGDPGWKYRNSLKVLNTDIDKLEETLWKMEAEMPLVVTEPLLRFAEDNTKGVFPAPPPNMGEYRFCLNQKADAFLAGSVSEFYGRIYVHLRLYTVYTRSFYYEDSILFSSDNTLQAVGELADRLVAAVSGDIPATIAVHAEPEEAVVLIKESFAGRGEAPVREHPPGEVMVEVFAENYESVAIPVELYAGELAELYINLRPLSRAALTVTAPNQDGAAVYQGALYIGQTPLVMDVFSNQYEYIRVEASDGRVGSAVFKRDAGFSGDAGSLAVETVILPSDAKPVETARRRFYGAYGRLWIALPLAFVVMGMSNAYISAYNYQAAANESFDMFDTAMTYNYASGVLWTVFGITLAETFYRIYRYTGASRENTAPIVK